MNYPGFLLLLLFLFGFAEFLLFSLWLSQKEFERKIKRAKVVAVKLVAYTSNRRVSEGYVYYFDETQDKFVSADFAEAAGFIGN